MAELLELGKEYPPAEEAGLIEKLRMAIQGGMQKQTHSPVTRAQHAKSHGCLAGELRVADDLPAALRVGIFARSTIYPVWVRFSNGMGRNEDGTFPPDASPDVRGAAMKVMLGKEFATAEQDFVFINSPIFFIRDVAGYLSFFPVAEAKKRGIIVLEKDKPPVIPEEWKDRFAAVSYAFKIVGGVMGQKTGSPLETRYWTATPYRLGTAAVKYSLRPHLEPQSAAPNESDHYRVTMAQQLAQAPARFDLLVQVQVDAEAMPVEDPTQEWSEADSPFVRVATVELFAQSFDCPERNRFDESLSFSPWNTLPEHAPLGGVNRARRIYQDLAELRNGRNATA
ncbi:MAG: catalase family protein [Vulcanimicrobiota bacterium]